LLFVNESECPPLDAVLLESYIMPFYGAVCQITTLEITTRPSRKIAEQTRLCCVIKKEAYSSPRDPVKSAERFNHQQRRVGHRGRSSV